MNDPSIGLSEGDVQAINNSGGTLYDGDVVVKDLANISKAPAVWLAANTGNPKPWLAPEYATTTTTNTDTALLGVVRCGDPNGVLAGGRMTVVTRGFHPGVRFPAGTTTVTNTLVVTGAAAASAAAPASAVYTGAMLGHLLATATAVTASATAVVPMFVDVK
jgi:hypothetical protein